MCSDYETETMVKHMIDDTAEIVCIERLGGLLKSYHMRLSSGRRTTEKRHKGSLKSQ